MHDEHFLSGVSGPARDVIVILPSGEWEQIPCRITLCETTMLLQRMRSFQNVPRGNMNDPLFHNPAECVWVIEPFRALIWLDDKYAFAHCVKSNYCART